MFLKMSILVFYVFLNFIFIFSIKM